MIPTLIVVTILVVGSVAVWLLRRGKDRRMVDQHTITPEDLHKLLDTQGGLRLFDVREPLELLAHAEIIPGSERVEPKAILADPTLIPKDEVTVVYCTCPGDATSRMILHKALALGFQQTKILRGGLDAWKEKGYAVEEYRTAFHLDTRA